MHIALAEAERLQTRITSTEFERLTYILQLDDDQKIVARAIYEEYQSSVSGPVVREMALEYEKLEQFAMNEVTRRNREGSDSGANSRELFHRLNAERQKINAVVDQIEKEFSLNLEGILIEDQVPLVA